MQANKIGPIPLKSKSQAVNQYEAYMNYFISPHTIAETCEILLTDPAGRRISSGISLSPCNNSNDYWNNTDTREITSK